MLKVANSFNILTLSTNKLPLIITLLLNNTVLENVLGFGLLLKYIGVCLLKSVANISIFFTNNFPSTLTSIPKLVFPMTFNLSLRYVIPFTLKLLLNEPIPSTYKLLFIKTLPLNATAFENVTGPVTDIFEKLIFSAHNTPPTYKLLFTLTDP